jgi:hypothetical protein
VCHTYKWLGWVCKAPGIIVNLIQGFASTVLLVLLFMLVPIILRILARLEGIPQKTGVELTLMDRFFMFQVIVSASCPALNQSSYKNTSERLSGRHIFVWYYRVFTWSSESPDGSSVTSGSEPTKILDVLLDVGILSLSYLRRCLIPGYRFIILQGLAGTATGFLQIGPLVIYYVKITLLASSPRSVYAIKYSPRTSEWGTLFPRVTQLVVIMLGYSIISPIINGLAFAAFLLFYFLYKYLFTWVHDQPPSSDTGGLFFPKAIQHIFVGLYVQQVCLCALFFLAENDHHKFSALPEGALVVILIIFTVSFV